MWTLFTLLQSSVKGHRPSVTSILTVCDLSLWMCSAFAPKGSLLLPSSLMETTCQSYYEYIHRLRVYIVLEWLSLYQLDRPFCMVKFGYLSLNGRSLRYISLFHLCGRIRIYLKNVLIKKGVFASSRPALQSVLLVETWDTYGFVYTIYTYCPLQVLEWCSCGKSSEWRQAPANHHKHEGASCGTALSEVLRKELQSWHLAAGDSCGSSVLVR